MNHKHLYLVVIASMIFGCTKEVLQAPRAGVIQSDSGGAVGYQHGFEHSRFIVGANTRTMSEFGFAKVVGSEGTFAVDAANGAVIAIPNANSVEQQKAVWYTRGADKHNQQVLAYFVAAGIPKDQISGVDATTSLYLSGGPDRSAATPPKIAGWQSVLERVINGVPVVDSVAWARLNEDGKVITEWVYWPPIPAKAIIEADQLRTKLPRKIRGVRYLPSCHPVYRREESSSAILRQPQTDPSKSLPAMTWSSAERRTQRERLRRSAWSWRSR